jgi:hypothetical protein
MAFVLESSNQWSAEDAQKVQRWGEADRRKRSLDNWVVDRDRDSTSVCFSVGRRRGWHVGDFALYVKGVPVHVGAEWIDDSPGDPKLPRALTSLHYHVHSIDVPPELTVPRREIAQFLREAFRAKGFGFMRSVLSATVTFAQGVGDE